MKYNALLCNDSFKRNLLIVFFIHILCACLAVVHISINDYLPLVLPTFTVSAVFVTWATISSADIKSVFILISLFNIGIAIQSVLGYQTTSKIMLIPVICLGLTIGFVQIIKRVFIIFKDKMQRFLYVLFVLTVALGGVLLLFGSNINGTKAWISIGNISIQLTDIIKLIAIYYLALVFEINMSKKNKMIFAASYMCTIGILMLLLNELGTVMIIFAVYLTLCIAYESNKKYKKIILISVGGLCILICAIYLLTGHLESTDSAILHNSLGSIFIKVKQRFDIWLHYDQIKSKDFGYQALKAKEAVYLGGWLGNAKYNFSIPVAESDYVFPALIMKFGLVTGIFVVLLYFALYYRTMNNDRISSLTVASATAFCLQAFIMIFGSSNFFIMTGIPIPLLSSGGTNEMISFILIYNMLSKGGINYEKH